MLAFYSHFPKQIRALDAIKRLNTYFETQGNTDKEPLPTMSKIVDYCIKHPRLLRIRDSPLRILHDPDLPYVVVHDWYIGISLDYLEASLFVLIEQWERDYKKKRHDPQQIADLFSKLVNDIYQCHEHTQLPLNMPFPEGSALAASELKVKVEHVCIALIKEKISYSFKDAQTIYYSLALDDTEDYFRTQQHHDSATSSATPCFAYLFPPEVCKYKDKELETKVQTILDADLPGLVDVLDLSDEILEERVQNETINDPHNRIPVNNWLVDNQQTSSNGNQETVQDSLNELEKKRWGFGQLCKQINMLNLTPEWTYILENKIKTRLNMEQWKDNWRVPMVETQLKWLHALILPWISFIMKKTEDIDVNWNRFLREKIKAEHVLYEIIYQSRIADIFDIIREFPTTKNAILDFHIVATKRGLLNNLKDELLKELRSRLLHQGASAADILRQYIACIQCLSIIDPSCGIMVPVIELVEEYMKTYRTDVVEGVVDLIRDDEDELLEKVIDQDIYVFTQAELNNEEIPGDLVIVKEDKPAQLRRLERKSVDSVAMLISVCNTLKTFIKGYSDKLGQILLSTKNYDTDAEVRRLELIKRNFPPDAFLRCDIMLKDVDDSRRLDRIAHENNGEIASHFHGLILSKQYWSGGGDDDDDYSDEESQRDNLQLWSGYRKSMQEYDCEFRKVKGSRKLKFLPEMGSVTLELEFGTRKQSIDVRPEAALIIALFETKEQAFTKSEIQGLVGAPVQIILDSLEFWMKEEILELSADGRFSLIEE